MLTYGGEVVAAHRLGDGWARRRRTGEAKVGDDEAAQRVDPLGAVLRVALGEDDGGALGREVLRAVVGATTRRRSRGRGAAARSSRGGGAELSVGAARSSGRRRRGGSTAQKWLSVGKGGEGKKYMGVLLSRVEPRPRTKGIFGRAGKIPSLRPTFSPGWIYHRDKRGRFPSFPPNLMFVLFLFTSLLK